MSFFRESTHGNAPLAVRAAKRLKPDSLVTSLAATALRLELDMVALWRGDSVSIKQLVEDFARYNYQSRLRDSSVVVDAIREGLGWLTWQNDTFAYAETSDEASGC